MSIFDKLHELEGQGWGWHLWTVKHHKKPTRYQCALTIEGQTRSHVGNAETPELAVEAAIQTLQEDKDE